MDFAIKSTSLSKVYPKGVKSLLSTKLFSKPAIGFSALKDITFDVPKGSCCAIIGMNGSGKSTLLQLLAGILEPSGGSIEAKGEISAVLELGSGFNSNFTGRENISLYASIMGMPRSEIQGIEQDIIDFAEIQNFIDKPLSTYSTGMVARLGFATRVFLDFDILILDEVLSVGDAYFQRKCFRFLENLKLSKKTIVFVSHSINQVLEICDYAVVLDEGRVVTKGSPSTCATSYYELINKKHKSHTNFDQPKENSEFHSSYGEGRCLLDSFNTNCVVGQNGLLLQCSSNYELTFDFSTSDNLIELDFGLQIRSITGVVVTGFRAKVGDVLKGTSYQLKTELNCQLNPGSYFLTCGFGSTFNDVRTFESRYVDFIQMTVEDDINNKIERTGIVSLVKHKQTREVS